MPTSHRLRVPGADLYYEMRGSGPVLMLIGHPMDSAPFAPIASLLATDHTVVTYDPRGFGQSTIDDPRQDASPDVIADDVHHVLNAVGNGPVQVLGSSGGAVTALALAALHPGVVRTIVAHEPPVTAFLPDAQEAEKGTRDIYETYQRHGIRAAWERFAAFTGMGLPIQAVVDPATQARTVADGERFFGHSLLPVVLYRPNVMALRNSSVRVVIAAGAASRGEFPHRTAAALAEHLGKVLIEFPGGHVGFMSDPQEFALVLRGTLTRA